MKPEITIIIPVYNAFEETLDCIQSVQAHSEIASQILVIDDASTQGDLAVFLKNKIKLDSRVVIKRNEKNLGFVGTCNFGFQISDEHDVLLLNSDTVVTSNWLNKMQQAAYSGASVATVTALSNNAVICSVPRFCQNNQLPLGYNIDQFAALIEGVSKREYPELPTCMGFCVYIKRGVLQDIGFFDAETFGKGYGEENDFSQRAINAGYINICDDATYVYHKGNCSFLTMQVELEKKNWAALNRKHPYFSELIAKFCRVNPLRAIQRRIQTKLLLNFGNKSRVLHIMHNGPHYEWHGPLGGTELHVNDLMTNISEVSHYSLVRAGQIYYLSAHFIQGERQYILSVDQNELSEIIKPELFDIIHLHHARWFNDHQLKLAILQHGNYVVSTHDYSLICPQFFLYTAKKKACTGFECLSECGYSEPLIAELRADAVQLLNNAHQIFCFSDSTRDNYKKVIDDQGDWRKVPHGLRVPSEKKDAVTITQSQEIFKIAFLGYIPDHKGARLIAELQKTTELAGRRLEWHVFGKLFKKSVLNIIDHGEYKRAELVSLLRKEPPNLVLILSECPETYSLTLDEAWAAGIPVLSTPLGAPAERVRATGAGWVLKDLKLATVISSLSEIITNSTDYNTKLAQVTRVPLITVATEAMAYAECYSGMRQTPQRLNLEEHIAHFERIELDQVPAARGFWRIIGKATTLGIRIVDTIGIRWVLQNAAYRFLPGRVLDRIKAAR